MKDIYYILTMDEKEPNSLINVALSKVYAVIVTYNAKPWIEKCLRSVINSTLEVKIIVIDNASSDDTVDYIKKNSQNVKLIELNKNYGFGKANNIGISYALKEGADFIYLLNQDAWVKSNTIEILLKLQKKNPDFGIVSPIHTTASEDNLDKKFRDYCGPNICQEFLDDLFFQKRKDLYEIKFVNAAHWLISRECLMNVGGFSPTFCHYGEDGNFIDRMYYHGFRVGICPLTIGIHDREFRIDTNLKKIYLKYIYMIETFSKISERISLLKDMTKYILSVIYYIIKYKSLTPLFYFLKFIFMLPKIIKNKNITKKRSPNFLEI
jgi:GT2 family glycosyltransferase